MKMCQQHWDALRTAIDDRGLTRLVSRDGEMLEKKLEGQLKGQADRETFDPLMNANLAIMNNALGQGGLYLMTDDYCPICESEQNGGHPAEWWITHAADEQLERAQELGLAPPNQ